MLIYCSCLLWLFMTQLLFMLLLILEMKDAGTSQKLIWKFGQKSFGGFKNFFLQLRFIFRAKNFLENCNFRFESKFRPPGFVFKLLIKTEIYFSKVGLSSSSYRVLCIISLGSISIIIPLDAFTLTDCLI